MTDPAARYSAFGDNFDNVPTAMVYDTFTEAASALRSRYTRLSDDATTSHERDTWWAKVLELRDAQHAVPAGDRAALIEHIKRWRTELTALESASRD